MPVGRILFKCVAWAILGALPGVTIAAVVNLRIGTSVALLGGFVGALLATPGTSVSRVLKMTATMIVARNLPISDRAYDWGDENETPPAVSPNLSDALMRWLIAADVPERRGWVVATGLVLGSLTGGVVAGHDVFLAGAGDRGLVLPFAHAKDSLVVQGVLLTLAFATWGGVAAAMVGAAAYRRPLLVAVPFAAFIVLMIGLAADTSRGGSVFGFVVMASSAAALLAMLVAACGYETEEEDPLVPKSDDQEVIARDEASR